MKIFATQKGENVEFLSLFEGGEEEAKKILESEVVFEISENEMNFPKELRDFVKIDDEGKIKFKQGAHDFYRSNGLQKVDNIHAEFMTTLTGNATRQEVDTWPPKVEASKFVMASTDAEITAAANLVLTDDPTANDDLETLVNDVGPEPDDLRAIATVILTKSRAYKRLIGLASKLRREAKEAVTAATDPAVPIEQVGVQLDTIEEQMTIQAQTAIQQWAG